VARGKVSEGIDFGRSSCTIFWCRFLLWRNDKLWGINC